MTDPVRIPLDRLDDEILRALIEEYVTREGTDYGQVDPSLEQKVAEVRRQLERGEAVVVFDSETETCNVVRSEDLA